MATQKKQQSKNTFIPSIIAAAIGFIIGLVIAIFSGVIIDALFVILGIMIILCSIPDIYDAITELSKKGFLPLILAAIPAIVGLVLIFWHNSVVMILIGVYLLIMPIIRIVTSSDPKTQFSLELRSLILGLVLILIGPGSIIKWAGWGLVVLSVGYTLYAIIKELKF